MASEPAVTLETLEDGIARLTLNRPKLLNAIDGALIRATDDALDVLSRGEHRVAILTGAGRGFCGADLSGTGEAWTEVKPSTPRFKVSYDSQVRLAELFIRLYELPIPVIAAVNGVAVGAGWRSRCTPTSGSPRRAPASGRRSSRPGSPRWTWAPATCCPRSSAPAWRAN